MVSTDIDRKARRASATSLIPAPAQAIFDVLADPRMHAVIDGGETVRRALDGVPARSRSAPRSACRCAGSGATT